MTIDTRQYGKTLTLTATGTDAKDQAVHNVTVYTKQ